MAKRNVDFVLWHAKHSRASLQVLGDTIGAVLTNDSEDPAKVYAMGEHAELVIQSVLERIDSIIESVSGAETETAKPGAKGENHAEA